jgi:hypothetical protein
MGKFQNVNFEELVVLKIAHDYNNKKPALQLFLNFEIFNSRIGKLAISAIKFISFHDMESFVIKTQAYEVILITQKLYRKVTKK